MEKEIWKPIPGWDGMHEISNTGFVRNGETRMVLKPIKTEKYDRITTYIVRAGHAAQLT